MTTVPERWRKSTRSAQETACVELSNQGMVRDSKNAAGPVLNVNIAALVAVVKIGRVG